MSHSWHPYEFEQNKIMTNNQATQIKIGQETINYVENSRT
jgi:hypothetical protein